jgi:hypothetical protein
MTIDAYHFTLTLTAATGTVDSPRPYEGLVKSFYVKYTTQSGPPSLVIKTKGSAGQQPSLTLLALAAANTDGVFYPEQPASKVVDGTTIVTWFEESVITDYITVAVTAGGTAGAIDVWMTIQTI